MDWWFIYKTPEHAGTAANKGFDFLYFDPVSGVLALSPVGLDQDDQALSHTLKGVFNAPDSAGFIVFNDEHVDSRENSSEKGHCKGILAFDRRSDSGLFLLHSTPRFPALGDVTLPTDEAIYGQSFICVTLPDYQTANLIAGQMLCQQNPQILTESSRMPSTLQNDEPLASLFHGTAIDESKQPSTLRIKSRGGLDFLLIAKSRKWGEDFWLDLVSPALNADLVVETWRRGMVTPLHDSRSSDFDEDTLTLCFKLGASSTYEWPYTKDHAKWAVSLKNALSTQPWVCVADLNRMVSQEKRGGGSLCFQEPRLWEALKDAEAKLHTERVQPESTLSR
ncbi:MAG: deoxyribonuclease II family protein [Chromatiaceae bacterium]|nr:deoxyribonuclease II family protein [Chromatiaceae bacterium]